MGTEATTADHVALGATYAREVRRGVAAVVPLWAGVIPFAVAFAVSARAADLTILETQALSMLVFAGSAQLAVVTLVAAGSGATAIVLTALALNLRHVLYGLWLGARLGVRTRPPRPVLAGFLTDESYGLTVKAFLDGRGSDAFLLGASLGLYVPFAAATLAGSLLGSLLPDPAAIGLDVVFPLSFLALLLPLLRSRLDLAVALVAGAASLGLGRVVDGGVAVLLATAGAATLGAALDRRAPRERC